MWIKMSWEPANLPHNSTYFKEGAWRKLSIHSDDQGSFTQNSQIMKTTQTLIYREGQIVVYP